jgi:hypothetical protein
MKAISIILFLVSFVAQADEAVRSKMHGILEEVTILQKFIVTESDFSDEKNEVIISHSIAEMLGHTRDMQKKDLFRTNPGLKTNLNMLISHLERAQQNFPHHKAFSRHMLNSALQMCIACHTRNQSNQEFALPYDEQQSGRNALDYAEFLMAIRKFTKAKTLLEKLVNAYPGNKMDINPLRRALTDLAVIYTRVKADPAGAHAFFSHVAKDVALPDFIKTEVKAWGEDFLSWSKEKKNDDRSLSAKQLLQKANHLLAGDDLDIVAKSEVNYYVPRLRAMAVLHELMDSPGNPPEKGEAMFLLGKLYHRLNHDLFFHFDEMYLEACIVDHPKTPLAQKCYSALEKMVIEGYTGSAGSEVPADAKAELAKYLQLAK